MRYCVIDVETMGKGNLKPILNCQEFTVGELLKDSGVKEVFYEPNDMANRIIELIEKEVKRNGRFYIYGWNIQYDFYAVFRDYLKESPIINLNNGKQIKYFSYYPFMAFYGKEIKGRFIAQGYFLDMMGFFRMSLKEFGDLIGLKKLEMPEKPEDVRQILPYLHRDCEITLEGFKRLKEVVNNLGFYPKRYLTAGNIAIVSFLTWCKKRGISWVFSEKGRTYQGKRINDFRNAFRGGRMECFQTGIFDDCVKLDINALYPYLMKEMDFPDLKNEYYTKDHKRILEVINNNIGIVKCKVKSPDNLKIGYLPIRISNLTFYPIGKTLDGTWTTLELKEAIKLGYELLRIDECIYFDYADINPFRGYMEYLWLNRKGKVGIEKMVIKLLMNSLYGKWSQYRSHNEYRFIDRSEYRNYADLGYKFFKTANDKYIMSKVSKAKLPSYANPMISIWITALARDFMYKQLDKFNREDLIYIATDGIIVKYCKEIDKLNIGKDIGQFDLEGRGRCKMLGENRYMFKDEIKIGGIPKRLISEDILDGKCKVLVPKIVSVKQALSNFGLKDKIGTFSEESLLIGSDCKNNIILPNEILELNKFSGGKYGI